MGYDKCPNKHVIVDGVDCFKDSPYEAELQALYDAWRLNGKKRGRYYHTLKGRRR
jgi:hypothetical protein